MCHRVFTYLAPVCGVCLLGSVLAASQAPPQQTPQLSDQYFKNVVVLKGLPVDEFLDTMGMFSAATGLNCTDCHVDESGGSWERYADDNPLKLRTRQMMVMMTAIKLNYQPRFSTYKVKNVGSQCLLPAKFPPVALEPRARRPLQYSSHSET